MPTYTFICDKDYEGCGERFNVFMTMQNYTVDQTCPSCGEYKHIIRDYKSDQLASVNVKLNDSQLKLHQLAKRNGEKMSADEMSHRTYENNKYKYNKESNSELPTGMKHMGYADKRSVSQKQSRKPTKKRQK